MHRVLPALAILVLLVTGCATRGSIRRLHDDLGALRAEVAALRQAQEQATRDAARALTELGSLDGSLRDLRARQEQTAAEVKRLDARLQTTEHDLQDARAARLTPAAPPPPTPERPAREVSPRPGGAEAVYGAALATFRAREHGQAVLEFLDFLARFPRHPLAANAQYWIGEAYYVQRDYHQALAEFQKVLEMPRSGPGRKAPDALLMMGLCHANLREPARAARAWERVIQEHPDSEAAARAKRLLRARRAATR